MPVGSAGTPWPDHLHGGRGKEHPNQCSHAEQMVLPLLGIFERERKWRFLVPVEMVGAACATHHILLSDAAPGAR